MAAKTVYSIEQLRGRMTMDQWQAFYAKCLEWGIPMDEGCLDYGSVFLESKAWFSLGWEAKEKAIRQ